MRRGKKVFFNSGVLIIWLLCSACQDQTSSPGPEPFPPLDFTVIKGADASFVPELEDLGASFSRKGFTEDLVSHYRRAGFNWIRLRLWNAPAGPKYYNGLDSVVSMAKRAKALGMKVLLDFHYSDTWADPGNQTKPAAWSALSLNDLKIALKTFTKDSLVRFTAEGVDLDMIQIGNEIGSGMLWPTGDIRGTNDNPTQWQQLGDLLKEALAGISEARGSGPQIPIMIHVQSGADKPMLTWFIDKLTAQGVPFDMIGLSYYPFWSNATDGRDWVKLTDLWNYLWSRYGKPVILAEVAYPWTFNGYDSLNNFVWQDSDLFPGYGATPAGQAAWLKDLTLQLKNLNQTGARGWFWWAPDWTAVPGLPSSWENLALFDQNRRSLPGLEVSGY